MKNLSCAESGCFFCKSCRPEWRELNKISRKICSFKRGEVIFKEGNPIEGMYFLLSGAVKVHQQREKSRDIIIRFAGGKDVLGYRGLGDKTYSISATTLAQTDACFISNKYLHASMPVNPELPIQLMQLYANELQLAEKRMSKLTHQDVKGRIAETLLTLLNKFGEDENGKIKLRISRQDIASYSSTSYETLFRIFSEWISNGIIKTEGKSIMINKKMELKKISQ